MEWVVLGCAVVSKGATVADWRGAFGGGDGGICVNLRAGRNDLSPTPYRTHTPLSQILGEGLGERAHWTIPDP